MLKWATPWIAIILTSLGEAKLPVFDS
jgi:hypothetical protein